MAEELNLADVFGSLTITKSDEPMPSIVRVREKLPNPFGPTLVASVKEESPYNIYVVPAAVERARSLINDAAKDENVGVRIVVNCRRDKSGALVKNSEGKATYIVERSGDHQGKVLIRYQGLPHRKKASAPRTHSIVNDPEGEKMLRVRATGEILARGTHDEMRAALAKVKEASA